MSSLPRDKLDLGLRGFEKTLAKAPLAIPLGEEKKEKCESKRITLRNIGEFSKESEKNIAQFLKKKENIDLIDALNLDLSDVSRQRILDELTSRWKTIERSDVCEMNFNTVNSFFHLIDYSHSDATDEEQMDLEDFLGRLLYFYCSDREVSQEQFKKLFSTLRVELLTMRTLSCIVMLDQCKELRRSDPEFSNKLVDMFSFMGNNDPIVQTPRFVKKTFEISEQDVEQTVGKTAGKTVEQKSLFEPKFMPVYFKDLKINEKYDIIDRCGRWYTGSIVAIKTISDKNKYEKHVVVSYDGFDSFYNETISERAFSENCVVCVFGSVTNGIQHVGSSPFDKLCECVSCNMNRVTHAVVTKSDTNNKGLTSSDKIVNNFLGKIRAYIK